MPTLGDAIVIGGGGRSVKSNSRQTVEFGLTGALSTDIPDKPKSRLGKTFALLTAAALFGCAAFSMSQPAKADGAFTVAGINSALPNWSPAAEEPVSRLSPIRRFRAHRRLCRKIGADEPKAAGAKISTSQFNDQAFSELQSFPSASAPASRHRLRAKRNWPKADNLLDWLTQPKSAAPAAAPPAPAAKPGKGKRSAAP